MRASYRRRQIAMTWALETIGTASKAKLSSVLPGGRCASARWRSIAAMGAFGQFVLGDSRQGSERRASPPCRHAQRNCGQSVLIVGSRSSLSMMPRRA